MRYAARLLKGHEMPHTALYRRRHFAGAVQPPPVVATITPIPTSIAITGLGTTSNITGVTRSPAADSAKTVTAISSNPAIASVSGSIAIADGATTSTGSIVVTGVSVGAFSVMLSEYGGGQIANPANVSGTVAAASGPAPSFTISSMSIVQGVAINRDLRSGLSSNAPAGGSFAVDGSSAPVPAGLTISGNYFVGTTNAAAVPNNGIKFIYTAGATQIVSNPFPIYILANTSFDSSGRWTPARDPDGTVPALKFAELPLKTWVEIANTNNQDLLKPIYDSLGETLYQVGSDRYLGKFTNYNGCAIEPGGRKTFFCGGGHVGGSDNSVDEWDTATLSWRIIAHPSKVGRDGFTAEDYQIFADSLRSWDGTGYIRAYSRSSTGFAAKIAPGFSHYQWLETLGPARFVSDPSEVIFANGDPASAWATHTTGVIDYDPLDGGFGDILPDHMPTPRHMYSGFTVNNANELLCVTRSIWKCLRDGTGWLKANVAGARNYYPAGLAVGESTWVLDDPVNNRVLRGGCGSNCGQTTPGYFYYGSCIAINKTTLATSNVGGLLPSTLTISQLNMGDTFQMACQVGRLGLWLNSTYASSFNLDTNVAIGYDLTGTYLNWSNEGRVAVHVPALNKILRFDTYAGRVGSQDPLPCFAMDAPANAGPVGPSGRGTLNIAPFAIDASALPSAPSILMYNRIWLYNNSYLVYVPFGDTNVFICRVA